MAAKSNSWRQWLALAACLAFSAALSCVLGQDSFWDTKNYHLYNAWAFLTNRYTQDIAPASMQSYFNPLLDVPYFWLATGPLQAWPRTLAGLQGLWYGLLVYLLFRIAMRLAQLQRRRFGWPDVCAVLIGATGTMAVSQVGSTTNEIALALLSLLGLYTLLPLLASGTETHPARRTLIAGLLCGVAAGLKPTAIVYPPAMAMALLFALGLRTRLAWQATSVFTTGVAAGFLASYGTWAWHLYQATGNPTFPMFNQLFHSPLTALTSGTDGQFRPRTIGQWLGYPLYWLTKQQGVVTETTFADPRYALAMLALLALFITGLRERPNNRRTDHGIVFLGIFVTIGFVLWMCLFSILRYAIPIEALTGLLVVAAMRTCPPWRHWPQLLSAASVALLLGVLAASTYPNWWRGAYADRVFEVDTGGVEPNSLVIFVGAPNAYLASMFPHADSISFVGLTWFIQASRGYGLWDQMEHRLRNHAGPRYVVFRSDSSHDDFKLLNEMLPANRLSDCRNVASSLETGRRRRTHIAAPQLCRLSWPPISTAATLEAVEF